MDICEGIEKIDLLIVLGWDELAILIHPSPKMGLTNTKPYPSESRVITRLAVLKNYTINKINTTEKTFWRIIPSDSVVTEIKNEYNEIYNAKIDGLLCKLNVDYGLDSADIEFVHPTFNSGDVFINRDEYFTLTHKGKIEWYVKYEISLNYEYEKSSTSGKLVITVTNNIKYSLDWMEILYGSPFTGLYYIR